MALVVMAPTVVRTRPLTCALLALYLLYLAPLGATMATSRVSFVVLTARGRKCAETMPIPVRPTPSALPQVSRPAHGRPNLAFTSIIISHRHRRGNSARARRVLRRLATSYEKIVMYDVLESSGGAAPCAAPTPQKRGPWQPLGIGCQGRLPTWKATPRREFPVYLQHYRYFLDAIVVFPLEKLELVSVEIVGAV